MAISFVAQTTGSAAATTSTTFSYTNTSSGDFLVLFVGSTGDSVTGAVSGVTDTASQVWTNAGVAGVSPTGGGIRAGGYGMTPYGAPVGQQIGGLGTRLECWYIANTANITHVTINVSTAESLGWWLGEYSGVSISTPINVIATGGNASALTFSTPSAVTTEPGDEVLVAFSSPSTTVTSFNQGSSNPTSGWTAGTNFDHTGVTLGRAEGIQPGANGSYFGNWTLATAQPTGVITVGIQPPGATTANPGTAGVAVSAASPVTGSGLAGFSGIQGIGIQGASVQGLQASGSVTSAPAGLASVSVTSPQATPSITPANVTGPAPVTVTANAPASIAVTVNAGLATVTVTAQSAIQTEASAVQAQVTVAAEQPSVPSGFSVLVAQVTAAAEQPNTQITVPAGFAQVQANANPPAGFSIQPSTAQTVTVAADQPSAQITVTAGLASVTATAAIPTFPIPAALASVTVSANNLSAFSLTAAAGLADPAATVPQPALSMTANAGLATVTVTGNSIPYAGSAHPGEATVLVSAFNASGTFALAGNAPVIVSANQPTNQITAKAGLATTTVTAAGITVPVSPGTAQVTVSVPQLKPSVTTAAELAMGFALALEAGSLAPLATGTINGLCVFEPPLVRDRPPYLPDSSPRQYALWRHFDNRVRGVNVWKRSDGTYCVDTIANYESAQTHPAAYFSDDPIGPDLTTTEQGLSDSNVNYPWNPFPGSTNSEIPGSYAYNVNWDQTTQDFIQNPYLVRMWQGGALNIILQSEAIELTQGGFGDCIDIAPPGSVYTAHQYKGGMNQ